MGHYCHFDALQKRQLLLNNITNGILRATIDQLGATTLASAWSIFEPLKKKNHWKKKSITSSLAPTPLLLLWEMWDVCLTIKTLQLALHASSNLFQLHHYGRRIAFSFCVALCLTGRGQWAAGAGKKTKQRVLKMGQVECSWTLKEEEYVYRIEERRKISGVCLSH